MKYGYARETYQFQDLEQQVEALRNAGCVRINSDKYTGKEYERPELVALLSTMNEGDILVVYKLDRIVRSLRGLVELLVVFNQKKINFISLDASDKIDTTARGGEYFLPFCGILSAVSKTLFNSNIQEGKIKARNQGKRAGRIAGSKNPGTLEKYQKAKKFLKERKPVTWITRELCMSTTTVSAMRKELREANEI